MGDLSFPVELEKINMGVLGAAMDIVMFKHENRRDEVIEDFQMHGAPRVSDADLERHIVDFFKLQKFEREQNELRGDSGSGFYYKGETGLHVYISNYGTEIMATVSEWDVPPKKAGNELSLQ